MIAKLLGLPLEVTSRKSKNDETKMYYSLRVYEFNKAYAQQALREVNLNPESVDSAKKLIGVTSEIDVELMEYKGQMNFRFVSGQPAKG